MNKSPFKSGVQNESNHFIELPSWKMVDREEFSHILSSCDDLRIFKIEEQIVKNKRYKQLALEIIKNRRESFGKRYYDVVISFFLKDYKDVTEKINKLLQSDIPPHAARNDNYFRVIYFIACETNESRHFEQAYEGLTFNLGLKADSNNMQTRRHAYIVECVRKTKIKKSSYRGIHLNPSDKEINTKNKSDKINIIGILRVRNEENIIKNHLYCMLKFVDKLVIYDDCSDDNTIRIIKEIQKEQDSITLIENEKWTFDESRAHRRLFEEARTLGGTHFVQLDADEVLSGWWLKNQHAFRQTLSRLQPGDCLALPWVDLVSSTEKLERAALIGKAPFFRGDMYKDVAYCDDGMSLHDKDNFIHVNIIPSMYNKRYIITDQRYGILHLENYNRINLVVKKDWYRIFEKINNNKKIINSKAYDIATDIRNWENARKFFDPGLSLYKKFDDQAYHELVTWRILYNYKAILDGIIRPDEMKHLIGDYHSMIGDMFPGGVPGSRWLSVSLMIAPDAKRRRDRLEEQIDVTGWTIKRSIKKSISAWARRWKKWNDVKLVYLDRLLLGFAAFSYRPRAGANGRDAGDKKAILAVCLGRNQIDIVRSICSERYNSKENIDILIYGKNTEAKELKDLEKHALNTGIFKKIYIDPKNYSSKRLKKLRNPIAQVKWMKKTIKRLGKKEYKEIILPKIFHPPEKFLAETFASAKIILFDEGMRSCVDMNTIKKPRTMYRRLTAAGIDSKHKNRICKFYTTQTLSGIPNYVIDNSMFRQAGGTKLSWHCSKVSHIPHPFENRDEDLKSETGTALILGQNIHGAGFMPIDQEAKMYAQIADWVQDLGYLPSFKPHPRDGIEMNSLMEEHGVELYNSNIYENASVEQIISNKKPGIIVGLISSALIFAKNYKICPAYTVIGTPIEDEKVAWDRDHKKIVQVIRQVIPPLSFHRPTLN